MPLIYQIKATRIDARFSPPSVTPLPRAGRTCALNSSARSWVIPVREKVIHWGIINLCHGWLINNLSAVMKLSSKLKKLSRKLTCQRVTWHGEQGKRLGVCMRGVEHKGSAVLERKCALTWEHITFDQHPPASFYSRTSFRYLTDQNLRLSEGHTKTSFESR